MELTDTIRRRHMVRRFDQRRVPSELIDRILDLARRAPTAGFAQGVDFLVLDTAETVADFLAFHAAHAGAYGRTT
jgi:nitroreductase